MARVADADVEARERAGTESGRAPYVVPVLAVAIAAFCFAFQETSILPAITVLQKSLKGATTSTVTFLESGYLVIAAVSAPTFGKLADRRGKKPLILMAMMIYCAGAIGAALAPNFAALVIFRALQGVGGAIFALSIAIMRKIAGPKLPIAVSVIVGGFATGITAGFAASGVITQALGWRWIFGIEAMLIPVGAILVWRFVPEVGERNDTYRDLLGAALLGFGIGGLLLALTFGSDYGWTSWEVLLMFGACPILLTTWWQRERRLDEPLIDVRVLRQPAILFPNIASALAGYAAFSTYLLVPRIAQTPHSGPTVGFGLGFGLMGVGLLMMPIGVGTLVGATSSGRVSARIGGKWPFVAGMALLALGPALLAAFRPNPYLIGLWLFVTGAGFGTSVGAAGTFVAQAAPENAVGVATSFNSLVRLVGGGIGSQVGTIILLLTRFPHAQLSHLLGYQLAFAGAAFLAAIGAVVASFTRVQDG